MLFADRASSVGGYRFTADGFLVADVKFARVGVQLYTGQEVDRADIPLVMVMRPVEEVFDAAAMRSFAGKPLTIGHPAEGVNAATWRATTVGRVGDEVWRGGDFVRSTILIQDAAAIETVKSGTRELSAGYTCTLEWQGGDFRGQAYQAVHRNVRGNHLALVDRARAGDACRIGMAA